MNERALIPGLCAAQVVGMLGHAGFIGQLPELRAAWSLSPAQAGWMVGAFHGGDALAVLGLGASAGPAALVLLDPARRVPACTQSHIATGGSHDE